MAIVCMTLQNATVREIIFVQFLPNAGIERSSKLGITQKCMLKMHMGNDDL